MNIPEWPSDAAVAALRESVQTILGADPPAQGLVVEMAKAVEHINRTRRENNYHECASYCGTLASLAMALQLVALAAGRQAREKQG